MDKWIRHLTAFMSMPLDNQMIIKAEQALREVQLRKAALETPQSAP